jgi:hypothetical protein
MSTAACAKNYKAAPADAKSGRLCGCIGCSVGSEHAGVSIPAPGISDDVVCSRCLRSASQMRESSVGMRLVRGTICVSCYNREKEVIRGRNAKGTPPRKWARLFPAGIGYVSGGSFCVTKLPLVAHRVEAMLTVMRRAPGPVSIGWVAARSLGGTLGAVCGN